MNVMVQLTYSVTVPFLEHMYLLQIIIHKCMENCEENYLFMANRTDFIVPHKIVIPTSVVTVTRYSIVMNINVTHQLFLISFFFFLQHAFYVQRHLDEVQIFNYNMRVIQGYSCDE